MKTRHLILIVISVSLALISSFIIDIYHEQIEWKEKVGLDVFPSQFPSCDVGVFVTDTIQCVTAESPPCTLPAMEQNGMCIVKKIDICEKNNVLKDGQCIPNDGNFRVDDPIFEKRVTVEGNMAEQICAITGGECPPYYIGNTQDDGSVMVGLTFSDTAKEKQFVFFIKNGTLSYEVHENEH